MARVTCQIVLALLTGVAGVRVDQDLSANFEQAVSAEQDFHAGEPITGDSGTYDLGKELGSGAYGKVYLATKQSTGEVLVAKIIDLEASPEAKTSFLTEGNVWQYMTSCKGYPHPNIIEYHEVKQLNARYGVVIMEKASGGSLSSLLYKGVTAENTITGTRTGTGDNMVKDEAEAKKLFGQIAAGAEWLAKCGVMHKDIKPDNIMLSKSWQMGGVAKIIDFGLAAVLEYEESGALANMYYNLVQSVDIRTRPLEASTFDDFALGLILAEIGTGVPPFFNPDYDYYSNKGNLQGEKGILYIQATKAECREGQPRLFRRMKALADLPKGDLQSVVGQVAGRSLYVMKNKAHFLYASAEEQSIDSTWAEGSWLYNSESAMQLLFDLTRRDATKRLNPTELLDSDWLSGIERSSGKQTSKFGGFQKPSRDDFSGGFDKPSMGGDFSRGKATDIYATEATGRDPDDQQAPLPERAGREGASQHLQDQIHWWRQLLREGLVQRGSSGVEGGLQRLWRE